MPYEIELSRPAEKDFRKLVPPVRDQVVRSLGQLAENPRNTSVSKLTDKDNTYRSRSGNFRILFSIFDTALRVLVLRILDRKDVYK